MSITAEAKDEVQRLLQQHRKLEAIRYLCNTFSISLQESKILVEALEKELLITNQAISSRVAGNRSSTTLDGPLKTQVIGLLLANKKIEAVKLVKTELSTGLKAALILVEAVDKEINPNYRLVNPGRGYLGGGFKIFTLIFGSIGLLLMGIAGLIYYFQDQTIKNSDTIQGVVVDFRTKSGGTVAPVIAYTWNGEKKFYHSSAYTNPPAYEMDEEVSMFVNRSDPEDVVVDTFSDRWLAITIVGGLGSFFLLFCALFMFAGRKF